MGEGNKQPELAVSMVAGLTWKSQHNYTCNSVAHSHHNLPDGNIQKSGKKNYQMGKKQLSASLPSLPKWENAAPERLIFAQNYAII